MSFYGTHLWFNIPNKIGYTFKMPSGDTPSFIVDALKERITELVSLQYNCFNNIILPRLRENGIIFHTAQTLPEEYFDYLKDIFLINFFLS